ncbi:hypothetical protein H6P81_019903 [Aristolochia fimbriata]|uniref:Nodulin-related protein 1 n=1 Tax=Aristolochia fimbriata TaxID=158543 RepID=A0AAV7DTZ5_ARIFI|nr:hypothetical protein H6P81_019903 [Aristolochia fimbriata]
MCGGGEQHGIDAERTAGLGGSFLRSIASMAEGSFGESDGGQKPKASMTELFSSAKVVTEAAQATIAGQKEKVDQGKAAGAAGDLLGGASHYGKLDDKGVVGGYVKKAETYLHEYEASHSTKPGGAAAPAPPNSAPAHDSAPAAAESAPPGGEGEKKESNYGDYLKMAQGFLK